LEVVQL
jgi:ABC-type multidrug transport system ATPase subunit